MKHDWTYDFADQDANKPAQAFCSQCGATHDHTNATAECDPAVIAVPTPAVLAAYLSPERRTLLSKTIEELAVNMECLAETALKMSVELARMSVKVDAVATLMEPNQ